MNGKVLHFNLVCIVLNCGVAEVVALFFPLLPKALVLSKKPAYFFPLAKSSHADHCLYGPATHQVCAED